MYVTDTHPLAHHINRKHSKLGRSSQRLFREADEGKTLIYVPSIVLWEMGWPGSGLLDASRTFDEWCRRLNKLPGFAIHSLEWEDIAEARRLPFRDPFDCLIAGTAIRFGLPLITRDQAIAQSGLVETVW